MKKQGTQCLILEAWGDEAWIRGPPLGFTPSNIASAFDVLDKIWWKFTVWIPLLSSIKVNLLLPGILIWYGTGDFCLGCGALTRKRRQKQQVKGQSNCRAEPGELTLHLDLEATQSILNAEPIIRRNYSRLGEIEEKRVSVFVKGFQCASTY